MATLITNQATLAYSYGSASATASSNIATATLQGPLTVGKTSLTTDYRHGEEITYTLTLRNNGTTTLNNIVIIDDLGTYTITGPVSVTPLTYIGPTSLYINGIYNSAITPTVAAHSVTFSIASLAAGSTAMVIYKAQINDYALLNTADTLTSIATFSATGLSESPTASYALDTEDFADVRIVKTMSPNPVTDGGILNYIFTIYNYGNMDATDVVLTDTFSPAPTGITVDVDGSSILASEYTYAAGLLTLPGSGATLTLTIPAATYIQNTLTGLVTINPGMSIITVSGTV